MTFEEMLPQAVASHRSDLLFVGFDAGELHFAFAGDCLFGKVACRRTSARMAIPRSRSGCITRTVTLRELFPASLPIPPPTPSSSSAICSAVLVGVPLSSAFAQDV
jgi:hypothetical protein